jgi:hypothetical protein
MADPKIDNIAKPEKRTNTYTVELLANRFGQAFGNVIREAVLQDYKSFPRPYLTDEVADLSKLGTPFFDRFIFRNGTRFYKFEIPPMVDVKRGKKLSITEIDNAIVNGKEVGGGEVIESMGNKAWDITFRGLLIDMDNHRRPLDQMRDLNNMFEINDVLDCKDSKVFNALRIDRLYVRDISFPPLEGFQDTQPFIIEARQYVPATLEILV